METEKNGKLPFLNVLVSSKPNLITSVYRKPTYTGLLTNFFSFTPSKYKNGLIKTLLDRCYKINNTWVGFDKDLENLTKTLDKNQFPTKLINKVTKKDLNLKLDKRPLENNTEVKTDTRFFKLPYIAKYSNIAQKKIQDLAKTFCKGIDVKVVLTPFKISSKFSYKDPLPFHLQSFIVYKFVCANCKVCYVGETTMHFITRINEHLQEDAKSNIFKYLRESRVCNSVCNKDCFSVIDRATTQYQLKMREVMHIKWIQPKLNKQVKHYTLSLIRNFSFSGNFEFKWMICVMQNYFSLKIMFDMFQSYFDLFQVSSLVQKYLHAIYEYIYQYKYL